ncbi:hypothetical protein [Sorangium sp. So ce363]|uniref:hypothetical protein n=1 Tax=Sorangium sp. So ce363 TaxID=3133304 RepID=UPI003F5F20EA
MAAKPPISVVSSGVVCSVGLSTAAACAAIRASIDSFAETQFIDRLGEPILGAPIPPGALELPDEADGATLGGDGRLARMFALAASECLEQVGGLDVARTCLLILGPEEGRPAMPEDMLRRRVATVESACGRKLHAEARAIQGGSPGLIEALTHARELLASPSIHGVLVAGADSLLDPEEISEALSDERLLTGGSAGGFIPGEAAACVLVTRSAEGDARDVQRAPALSIAGLGMANEPQTLRARQRSRGVGLSRAIRQALEEAGVPADAVHARYADISGEPYFFEEASYAWTRVLRGPSPPGHKLFTPVTRVGHIGAAMAPLLLAIALDDARNGRAAGPNTLVHLSCSAAPRGALLLVAS